MSKRACGTPVQCFEATTCDDAAGGGRSHLSRHIKCINIATGPSPMLRCFTSDLFPRRAISNVSISQQPPPPPRWCVALRQVCFPGEPFHDSACHHRGSLDWVVRTELNQRTTAEGMCSGRTARRRRSLHRIALNLSIILALSSVI